MPQITGTFTGTGNSLEFALGAGQVGKLSVTGTFVATALLQKATKNRDTFETVRTLTSGVQHEVSVPGIYRVRCSAFTSGVVRFTFGNNVGLTKLVFAAGAKVGATAGWVVNAADNKNSLGRLPASQTASTLVVPLTGLKVGDVIRSFHLIGQIESAGGTVTVDAALRRQTAAAADLADASVGAITQLSAAADTIMSEANTNLGALDEEIGANETFYVLITGTTAASTDIDFQGVAVTIVAKPNGA